MGQVSDYHVLHDEEKTVRLELEKWHNIEESVLKQKSRVNWLKLGDSNTSFFHACIRNRLAQNQIRTLTTIDAAHQLPSINSDIMKRDKVLNRRQQLLLIAPVTKEEVMDAMKNINDNKALGNNGYNALFYKKTWGIIGDEVIMAVLNFFEDKIMHKPLN
ncbi:uncharacterized protein LOC132637413 [Lycium barbarum]|uniref:uncharacterized protein LOC132637413 n=1 Tax=Lycium barbarum TaxID=112863 RepID=UPI00293F6F17|nr:uncharacterized protein LOC132637413 [Lycium barbarum]